MTFANKTLSLRLLNSLMIAVLISPGTMAQETTDDSQQQQTSITSQTPETIQMFEDITGISEDAFNKDECSKSDFDINKFKLGMVLRVKAGQRIDQIVADERSAGRNPKVLLIARAGQDLKDALVLKDEINGQLISVTDIFNDILYNSPIPNEQRDMQSYINDVQQKVKAKYRDPNRSLQYSHLGLLVINDPIINTKRILTKAQQAAKALREKNSGKVEKLNYGGQYWIRELLKPCESLDPYSWRTGLAGFFQDNPHQYKAIVMVPDQKIQDIIHRFLVDRGVEKDANYDRFLADKYNTAAAFYNIPEQNSNQFLLEIFAAAQLIRDRNVKIAETNRTHYINQLRATGFRPTKILADSFMLKMAATSLASKYMKYLNIQSQFNPYAQPYAVTEIVTELSVREYLLRQDIIQPSGIHEIIVTPDDIKNLNLVEQSTHQKK